jgi:3-phenylpropionate/cinnamic acid dioxygenase small subunit
MDRRPTGGRPVGHDVGQRRPPATRRCFVIDPNVRQDIAEVLIRYATGIDRRDWDLFRTCFTVDCVVDYGDIGLWHGADEVTEWMDRTHRDAGHTLHRITNQAVDTAGDGASARAYVDAIVMSGDNASGVRAVGFYDDELVNTTQGWQIARRRFTPVFYEGIGLTS